MMSVPIRHAGFAVIFLLVAGLVRMPIEQSMTHDFRERGMLQQPLDVKTTKKIGQGFWAVSLGGLRTLVATVLNLRAFGYFEAYQWTALAETYDLIVQLAPRSEYYWDTGAWHMAYNAASHYQYDSDLPELEARAEWRRWIRRGTVFLEEGARLNPDSMLLWKQLGWLYSDTNRLPDFEKAAEAYERAIATGKAPDYLERFRLYAMARSEAYIDEALPLARELHANEKTRTPTLNCMLFALECRADPEGSVTDKIEPIFGQEERAYRSLKDYYLNDRENFPMNGVIEGLIWLENRLEISEKMSIFDGDGRHDADAE